MKRALITGAAAGIGRALAERYAAGGYEIVGVDRDREAGERTEAELRARNHRIQIIESDLSDSTSRAALIERLAGAGPFDAVIHNAGFNDAGHFRDFDPARQRPLVQVNFVAPMTLTAALLARERLAPGGSIVFFSSLSSFVGYPGAAVYAAAKEGLAAYARSLGVALRSRGVHVMTVYPGPTRTAMAESCSPIRDPAAARRRMAPERVAELVFAAMHRRRRVLIPGFSNRVMAAAGRWLPKLTERMMRRAIFEKLERRPP